MSCLSSGHTLGSGCAAEVGGVQTGSNIRKQYKTPQVSMSVHYSSEAREDVSHPAYRLGGSGSRGQAFEPLETDRR